MLKTGVRANQTIPFSLENNDKSMSKYANQRLRANRTSEAAPKARLSAWFTEMGMYGAVPWQETAGLAVSLALSGGAALWALRRFHRKDVA